MYDVYSPAGCVLTMRDAAHALLDVPVINLQSLGPYIFIQIPPKFLHDFWIEHVSDISDSANPVDATELLKHHFPHRMWIRCPKDEMNLAVGMHKYMFTFVRAMPDDKFELFVTYTIQSDAPDRPYYYMEGIPE